MADRYYATPTQDEKSSVKRKFVKKGYVKDNYRKYFICF